MNPNFNEQPIPKTTHGAARMAVQAVCRPPRQNYDFSQLNNISYDLNRDPIQRVHVSFKNRNGLMIVGSLYQSVDFSTSANATAATTMSGANDTNRHCLIYLHGNVSSQKEGVYLVRHVAPHGVSVFCFDFTGCGLSEGEYVTMGYNEHFDVLDSIAFLTKMFHMKDFVLFGRSMGAAAALLAAPEIQKQVAGIISDSSFTTLWKLFKSLSAQASIPGIVVPVALLWMKNKLEDKAKFNLCKVKPIECVKKCHSPLLMGHAKDDSFVPFEMAEKLLDAYKGKNKELFTLSGGHNGNRGDAWHQKCVNFVLNCFGIDEFVIVHEDDESRSQSTETHAASFNDLLSAEC